MQGVMWAVLGITVVLAAMVSRSARSAGNVDLSKQTVTSGDISVRLPTKWRGTLRGSEDPRVIAQAAERSPGEGGRTVRILRDHVQVPVSPLKYLIDAFGVSAPGEVSAADDEDGEGGGYALISTTRIGPATGVIVAVQRQIPRRGRPEFRKDVYAAAVLPTLDVVVIALTGDGPVDVTDHAVVRQIASGITLSGAAAEQPNESGATLPEGIQVSAPEGFGAVPQADPNRTDRLFLPTSAGKGASEFEKSWSAIEVVGCLFPALDEKDPNREQRATSAMTTLLLARDPRWRDAKITFTDGAWRAEPPDHKAGADAFPMRAYLLPDPSGRALLAVLHGGFGGGGGFDRMWKQLSASTKFLPSSDTAQLEDAGGVEAGRLRQIGWAKLLADADEQWWLWTDASDRPHVGWSHFRWEPKDLSARTIICRRDAAGDVTRVTGEWNLFPDKPEYTADDSRSTSSGTGTDSGDALRQGARLRNGQLALTVNPTGAVMGQWKMPTPSQFVPGGVLPLVMGKLEPGPLLLKTESFPGGWECIGAPQPLSVIIRPDPQSTRKAEGEDKPLRCVTAQVNGSGRVSRWYFRSTGELESVEFAGKVQRVESDLHALRVDFGRDGQMSP
jgi:hypothetical protein